MPNEKDIPNHPQLENDISTDQTLVESNKEFTP